MEIRKNLNGATLELALEGRLDTSTSPALEQELRSSLSGITGLVFDLKDLDYLSSAGLRVLLFAQKRMNGKQRTKRGIRNDDTRGIPRVSF